MLVTAIEARPLRSLERVRVELGPGITSVVGPNGVGKTNLVEALYFADEGHGWQKKSNRLIWLRAVAGFLTRYLRP